MHATKTMRTGLGRVGRRWRAISPRRRLVLLLLSATIGGWGAVEAYLWWTTWAARLVLATEKGHHPIAFSPDDSTLLTRDFWGGDYHLWDISDGNEKATWTSTGKRSRFSLGALSPDGRTFASPWYLASSGMTFSVDLIDVGSGKVRSTFDLPLGGLLGVRFKEGGRVVRLLAAGKNERQVVDVDAASGKVLSTRALKLDVAKAFLGFPSMSDDGRFMVVQGPAYPAEPGSTTTATVWDLDEDREVCRLPGRPGASLPSRASFSPDRKSLALGFEEGSIEIWDLASQRLRATSRDHQRGFRPSSLTFSPDGSILASHGEFRRLTLSFGLVRAVLAHVFRARDNQDVSELLLLDSRDGQPLVRARSHGDVAFSPDGRTLATSHEDGNVRIHDVPKPR